MFLLEVLKCISRKEKIVYNPTWANTHTVNVLVYFFCFIFYLKQIGLIFEISLISKILS